MIWPNPEVAYMAVKAHPDNIKKRIKKLDLEKPNLSNNHSILMTFLEASNDILLVVDKKGTVVLSNTTAARVYGRHIDKITGTCLWDYYSKDDSKIVKEHFNTVFQTGKPLGYADTKGASWYYIMLYPIFDADSKPAKIAVYSQDITDLKNTESLLKLQRDLGMALSDTGDLREILSMVLDTLLHIDGIDAGGIYLVDETTGGVNLAVHKGLPEEFIKGATHFNSDSPGFDFIMQGIPIYWDHEGTSKKSDTIRIYGGFKGVAIIPVIFNNKVIASINLVSFQKTSIPIIARVILETIASRIGGVIERTKAQETLAEREKRYSTLFDSANDAILIISDGIIIDCNNKSTDTFKCSKDDLLGQLYETFLSEDQHDGERSYRRPSTLLQMVLYQEPLSYECIHKCPDGTLFESEVSLSSTELKGEYYIQAIIRDITDRKKREEEQIMLSKFETISRLSAGIAHDFNNLLSAITGNIELAESYHEQGDKTALRLSRALEACSRAKDLISQFAILSRSRPTDRASRSISPLIRASANIALTGSDIRHECYLPDDLWTVEFDDGQIMHAINNIIINAKEAMPHGGAVNITAGNVFIGKDRIESSIRINKGPYVRISVHDAGKGIDQESISKIFDPYFSTKDLGPEKGIGFGLTTAYYIINRHGGYLFAESTVGKGTTLVIYLPATIPDSTVKKNEQHILDKGKILLMDNDEMIRDIGSQVLGTLGYNIETTYNSSDTIDRFRQAHDSDQPFDAVILDITLRGGSGGKETLKQLKKIDPKVRCILSSRYKDDPIIIDYDKYGFSGFTQKPFKIKELSRTLYKIIKPRDTKIQKH